jgi:hypothetical protein
VMGEPEEMRGHLENAERRWKESKGSPAAALQAPKGR